MRAQTAAGNPQARSEARPGTGLSPALITALATQLATMLVADLRDHVRHGSPESRPPASGRTDQMSKTAGPATEDGADTS